MSKVIYCFNFFYIHFVVIRYVTTIDSLPLCPLAGCSDSRSLRLPLALFRSFFRCSAAWNGVWKTIYYFNICTSLYLSTTYPHSIAGGLRFIINLRCYVFLFPGDLYSSLLSNKKRKRYTFVKIIIKIIRNCFLPAPEERFFIFNYW